jgi:putative ABC transport system permease protein
MSTTPRPPRFAAALLARVAPEHWYESLAGDLMEAFAARHRTSRIRAVWWYRWQVFRILLAAAARVRLRRFIHHGGLMTRLVTDVVSAWRALRRRPRFALILITLLGASLGTSAAVLTIAESYLWRPLPYPAADRLVTFPRTFGAAQARPPQDLSALQRDGLLAEVADLAPAIDVDGFTIADGATPTTVLGLWTTADLFDALGVRPVLGRTFTAEEVAAQHPVALISHSLWIERYAGDPSVVGRRLTLRGVERTDVTTPFTVIGVLPPRFWHLDERIAIVAPLKEGTGDVAFFRLKEGTGIEPAATRLTELVAAMNPTVDPGWRVRLERLQDDHVEPIRELLSAVSLAVLMLVLIACANVAMLQATRALGREQEMAIRSALGAGRARVCGQLVAENLLLAMASFGLAILVARALTAALVPAVELYVGRTLPGGFTTAVPGFRVIALVAAVSLIGTVVFGVLAGARVPPGSEAWPCCRSRPH